MLDFNWSHTGDKPGETLKTDFRISRSDGDSDSANTTVPTMVTVDGTQHQSSDQKNGVLSVDYTRNVGQNDQLSIYSISASARSRILSSVSVSPRRPLICARPVMPGLTLWRAGYLSSSLL